MAANPITLQVSNSGHAMRNLVFQIPLKELTSIDPLTESLHFWVPLILYVQLQIAEK